MARVVGVWTSPARKSGVSEGLDSVGVEAGAIRENLTVARVLEGGEVAVGDDVELL